MEGWIRALFSGRSRSRLRTRAWIAISGALLGALIVTAAYLSFGEGSSRAFLVLIPILGIAYLIVRIHRAEVSTGLRRLDALMRTHLSTIEALTIAIDAKDPLSRGHVRRVQAYALVLASRLRIPEAQLQALRTAALLHDIGKLAIPDHLLNKPGRLSAIEFQKVKAHPAIGAEILSNVEFPYPVLPIIRHHHERWDGSGYPDGLAGEAIPCGARILAVADTFEALTSDRAYRKRRTPEEAAEFIASRSGADFDPGVVATLHRHLEAVVAAGAAMDGSTPSHGATAPAAAGVADRGGFGASLHRGFSAREEASDGPPDATRPPGDRSVEGALGDIYSAQREVYALYEIAQTLGSSLRLEEVLELVVSKIGQLVPYRTCAIYLARDGGEWLTARFVCGANAGDLRGRSMQPGEGITGWAAQQRSARFSTSPELDLAGIAVEAGEYSMVAAFPICHDAEVLGVITLYFPRDVPCQDDHIRIMDLIAKLSAGAVFNSTVFTETQEFALTDDLTNLPNSRHLRQMFEQERIRSQQSGQPMALLEMDLDRFKPINDRHGHARGDLYLKEVARILRGHLRDRDVLVRLSGDEFAAILPLTGFAPAALLAERLQQAVDTFVLKPDEKTTLRAGLSVGVAIYPHDGESLETLLAHADANMYRNKRVRRSAQARPSPNVIPFPIRSPAGIS
jgi:diguanylate cyclase (GGDEF)-like protein/putative nucleotidyltransferase with HDIG domain